MYLPLFYYQKELEDGEKPKNYFLFSDVLCAITHLATEVDCRENELKKLNIKNKLFKEIEKNRNKLINKIKGIK